MPLESKSPSQPRSAVRRVCASLATLAVATVWLGVIVGVGAAGSAYYFRHQTRPVPLRLTLAPGVVYERRIVNQPRCAVIHLIACRLSEASLEPFVTPTVDDSALPFRATTTLEFLRRSNCLVAVNGDYFAPQWCHGPLDYAPRAGEPVAVMGPSASQGRWWVPPHPGYFARHACTLSIEADGRFHLGQPVRTAPTAISGRPVLIREGALAVPRSARPFPQTALGWDGPTDRLWLVVVDGRQPGYSEGLSDAEVAELLIGCGATFALRLDGGGSSTLALRLPTGATVVANRPIHGGIPGWERPVANHFGLRLPQAGPVNTVATQSHGSAIRQAAIPRLAVGREFRLF